MDKIKSYFSKNVKLLTLIIIIIAGYSILFEKDLLLEKLNNNKELIKKYNEFKIEGINKPINLPDSIIENIIDTALSFVGTPNIYGGTNKEGIDASALVHVSITKNDKIAFPRIAQEMARYGEVISDPMKLDRGDLVFFYNTYEINRIITSVGIYLGEGNFITSTSSKGVAISEINDGYWQEKFFYGTRIVNQN